MNKLSYLFPIAIFLTFMATQSNAYTVNLEINNLTDKTITTPGMLLIDRDGVETSQMLPQINKVIPPYATHIPIDYPQTDLEWWGLISLLVYDVNGNLLVPCLEDTYWAVGKNKTFEITVEQHDKHPYYTCKHN